MADHEESSPQLTIGELAQLLSPAVHASTDNGSANSDERRFIWVAQPDVNGIDSYEEPPATTNGTHSESLTRLQSGYLRAISALEDRNKFLQQELDKARSKLTDWNAQVNNEATQRITDLEERNDMLQRELRLVRARPDASKAAIGSLQVQVAKKNEKLKEKNSQILHIEQTNRRLQDALMAERKKNGGAGAGASADTTVKKVPSSHKKRKHVDFVRGTQDNPWEL